MYIILILWIRKGMFLLIDKYLYIISFWVLGVFMYVFLNKVDIIDFFIFD